MRVFKEEQRFNQLWLIALIAISAIIPIILVCVEYFKNQNSISTLELILIILLLIFFSGLIFIFKLSTKIDELGIHYKFFPLHLKYNTISWKSINNAYIRTYEPISEYGGWGIKGGWKKSKGKASNVSGTIGIQLELADRKKLLIGTKKQIEAENTIAYYKTQLNHSNNV